jgi:hypothetical protein
MADEVITELWRVKDELSKEAGKDLKAFCKRLNEGARLRGEVLINRSHLPQMKVAEHSAEYIIRPKT